MKSSWKHPLCSNQGHSHGKFHVHPLLRTRTRIRSCSKFHCDSRPRLSAPTRSGYVKFFSKWLFWYQLSFVITTIQTFEWYQSINRKNISWTFASSKPPKRKVKDLHNASKPWLQPCSSLAHHNFISSQQWFRLSCHLWLAGKSTCLKEAAVWGRKTTLCFVYLVTHKVEIECFHLKGNNTWPGGKHLCSWIDMEKNIFGLLAFKKQAWSSMDCQKVAERGTGFQWQTTSSFHK